MSILIVKKANKSNKTLKYLRGKYQIQSNCVNGYNIIVKILLLLSHGLKPLAGRIILLFLSSSIYAYMDYPYGVAFQIIHPPLLPLDNVNPGAGKLSGRMAFRLINVWSIQSNRFITDGEEGQFEPSLRYAFTDKLQFGFSAPLIGRGGGFLDESIEIFHRSIGVGQGERDRYPRNQFNVSYEPLSPYYPLFDKDLLNAYLIRTYDLREYPRRASNPPLDFPNQGDAVRKVIINKYYPYLNEYKTEDFIGSYDSIARGNPKTYFQYTLWNGDSFINKITVGMQIKIPIRSVELIGTPGTDISGYAVFHKDLFEGKLNLKCGISYSNFQIHQYRSLALRGNQWVLRPSVVYNLNLDWMVHLEYVYYASPVLNWNRLSSPAHQVGLGISRKFNDYQLQFAGFENILTYSSTPDIGFLISFEKFSLN